MKESPLEAALRTIPATYSVNTSTSLFGGTIVVKDCVDTEVLSFSVFASNSGDTCGIVSGAQKSKMSYIKEWDEDKVMSKVIFGFYATATSFPKASYEAAILRELRTSQPKLPPAVTDTMKRVRKLYIKIRGRDIERIWEEGRKLLKRMSRLGVTEEDLVKEWRETLIKEVQDS